MNRVFTQNKIYRVIQFAPIMIYRLLRKKRYQHSSYAEEVRKLKNTKWGESCFIIGNGPSLKASDLEMISGIDSFATNRIYEIFDNTNWRPTYYLAIDNNVLSDNLPDIVSADCKKKFLNYTVEKRIRDTRNITFINIYSRYILNPAKYKFKTINYDVSKSFSLSYSVTGTAIQLAIYMGYKKIYLLGVDNRYSTYITRDGKIHNENVKDYFGKVESKSYTIMYRDAVNSYYNALHKFARENQVYIANATRGGALEVFPRISLEDSLKDINETN